ncbi:PLDc_N domain-containing protein [Ornithinibacillus gellani]|uniref:PLD nuclease N-terminal domain-containing protein n=1 Tax=Ornithinibacillus gellani TaxID=2293253 RepID=UPI000F490CEE|nr:PLD nuclease N-terminal domain-containing protein [Ornithinibacillus gellani]TQS70632.1 PLDc_N domain-containing protein [Ornithinibacillus gellani]
MAIFNDINWAAIAPLLVIQGLLILIALIDWLKGKSTNGPRSMWLIFIIFLSMIGPILYFVIGRRQE